MRRLTLLWLTFLLIPMIAQAQQPCDLKKQSQDAADVLRLQNELRGVREEDAVIELAERAQSRLPEFKKALAQAIRDTVACDGASEPPKKLQAKLAQLLHANPPQPPPNSSVMNGDPRYTEFLSYAYASNLLVEVKETSSYLLSVQTSFHILCGDDTIWMLFERQKERWVEKLIWQAPPYKEVGGAFGDLFFTAILPGDNPGEWRALAVHGTPWCMSRFSSFVIDLLAPSGVPSQPRVVWHTSRGYSRGDYASRLSSKGNTFEFRTNVPTFDAMDYERTVVYRYALSHDHVERLGPIAVNGLGFVEEWLEAPWDEAKRFSDKEDLVTLKNIHDKYEHSKSWNPTYGPIRVCHDSTKHFQVELHSNDSESGSSRSYYQIQENGEGYTMMVADSPKPDPRCPGLDLMKKH